MDQRPGKGRKGRFKFFLEEKGEYHQLRKTINFWNLFSNKLGPLGQLFGQKSFGESWPKGLLPGLQKSLRTIFLFSKAVFKVKMVNKVDFLDPSVPLNLWCSTTSLKQNFLSEPSKDPKQLIFEVFRL